MRKIKRIIYKAELSLSRILRSKSYMKIYNKYLRACGMEINGNVKFIHSSVYLDLGYASNIHIGDNCVLSVNTIILAHDFSVECGMNAIGLGDLSNEKKLVKDVHIGDNVFVGCGCIILPGTRIGNNCIIGAGSVCSGVIPDNSIITGEKGKVIANTIEWAKQKNEQYGDLWNTK